jgi:TPR repeat protein
VKPARSTTFDRALKIAQAQKTPSRKAYDLLRKADAAGDVRATYALATWYLFGSPFTKVNLRHANAMLRRAAAGGSADAAYDLAVSYEKGAGIRKSEVRAFELYVQAALLGDAQSHYEVGRMYFWGIGTPRNRTLAEAWFKKAKSLGIEG